MYKGFNVGEARLILRNLERATIQTAQIIPGQLPRVDKYHTCQVCGIKSLFVRQRPNGRYLCPTHENQGMINYIPKASLPMKIQKKQGREQRIKIVSQINREVIDSLYHIDEEKVEELRKKHLSMSAKRAAARRYAPSSPPPPQPQPIKKQIKRMPFSEMKWKKCQECKQVSNDVFYHQEWKMPVCPKCAKKIKKKISDLFSIKIP